MRLIELIVVTIVVFVLSALGVKAIQFSEEASTKLSSTNHIKKLVEGIQKYETTMGYLPPARTTNSHPGWNLRILPYMGYENVHSLLVQAHLYDKDYQGVLSDYGAVPVDPYDIGDKNSVGAVSMFSGNPKGWYRFTVATSGNPADAVTKNDGDGINWNSIHNALAGVAEYRNPSRQPQPLIKKVTADTVYSNSFTPLKFDSDVYEQSCMRGVVSDYAAACSNRPLVLNNYTLNVNGDFANAVKSEGWDKSQTFVIGEKYIPSFALIDDTPISNMWNGGLHRTHPTINALNSSLRYVNLELPATNGLNPTEVIKTYFSTEKHPIAVTNGEVKDELSFLVGDGKIRYPSNFQTGEYLWGSNTPDTISIGVLDGSVKAVSKKVNAELFNRGWCPKPVSMVFVD
jgi:hypothetical protein